MPASKYTLHSLSTKSPSSTLLDECNRILLSDFGPNHSIDPPLPPDLLVLVAKTTQSGTPAGVVTLHHDERTRAWELGTVSAAPPHSHGRIMRFLLREAPAAIREWYGSDGQQAWLVKRVKQDNAAQIATLRSIGFVPPPHFMVGILSDDGYIPFDPVDEMLMKKAVFVVGAPEG